jgi:hypothetical protein
MFIAGIDPGANGAIAVLDSKNPDSVALLDLNKCSIKESIAWLRKQKIESIWLESVHSLYGMSAKSNFGFGRNFGIAFAIAGVAVSGGSVKQVTPKVWQKYVGVTAKGKAIKQQVAKIAQYLYPQAELHGKRGGLLDGRSDALMIAYYGLHNLKEKV